MKKIIVLALLLGMVAVSSVFATDWSQYESGRDNIRLDGYQGQPGYIAFTDGNGIVRGYVYMDEYGALRVIRRVSGSGVSSGAFDLTTTKLGSGGDPGLPLDFAD
jgi:hypothetical protein